MQRKDDLIGQVLREWHGFVWWWQCDFGVEAMVATEMVKKGTSPQEYNLKKGLSMNHEPLNDPRNPERSEGDPGWTAFTMFDTGPISWEAWETQQSSQSNVSADPHFCFYLSES